eukprot:Awhi_evm1s11359
MFFPIAAGTGDFEVVKQQKVDLDQPFSDSDESSDESSDEDEEDMNGFKRPRKNLDAKGLAIASQMMSKR